MTAPWRTSSRHQMAWMSPRVRWPKTTVSGTTASVTSRHRQTPAPYRLRYTAHSIFLFKIYISSKQSSTSEDTEHVSTSKCTQIAKFMGPTWGPPGPCRSKMGPRWSHEPCYQGVRLLSVDAGWSCSLWCHRWRRGLQGMRGVCGSGGLSGQLQGRYLLQNGGVLQSGVLQPHG